MKFYKLMFAIFFMLALPLFFAGCGGGSTGGSGGGTATVSGKVEYEDRAFDLDGFTGATPLMPVRFAIVQAVKDGTTVLEETTTAADGTYTLSNVAYGTGDVTIRALTDSESPFASTVRDTRDSSIYAVVSSYLSTSGGVSLTVNLIAGVDGAGPAFNIFDNLILGQERLSQFAPTTSLTQITIYWWDGGSEGSYYTNTGDARIYLVGTSTDDDAYDDTVILHELGHYAADIYSQDDSKGGNHTLTGHYDLRLTWSEGWATFFGSLVRGVSGISSPEYYVDTLTASTLYFSYDIESMSTNSGTISASTKGADNEVAVSAILWDIYDYSPYGEWGSENLFMGYDEIWSVFDNDIPTDSVATFETFWDKWEANVSAGQLDVLLAERDIRYSADGYEDDDTAGTAQTAAAGFSQQHTFFPADDKDWFKINVTNGTTYTFKTGSLGDGGDTLITLYDTNGTTQLEQNDDDLSLTCVTYALPAASTTPCLASKIVWTADATKLVYLLVESYRPLTAADLDYDAGNNPDAISKYGYYTLTITSP